MVSKSTSILLAVAVVAVSAVAIIGLGYAYTAATENSDNDASAKYVTLSQNDYTWGETALVYDTITKKSATAGKLDFIYTLMKDDTNKADQIPGVSGVYGVQIGTAEVFKAVATGGATGTPYAVTAEIASGTFNTAWNYYIILDKKADGSDGAQMITISYDTQHTAWAYVYDDGNASTATDSSVFMKDGVEYSVSLYVGKNGGDDATTTGTTETNTVQVVNLVDSGTRTDANAPAAVVTDGSIKFTAVFS